MTSQMSLLPQEQKSRRFLAVAWFFASASIGFLISLSIAFLPRDPAEVLAAVPSRMARISSVHFDIYYDADGPFGFLAEDSGLERFSGKVSGGIRRGDAASWRAVLNLFGTSEGASGTIDNAAEARVVGHDGYLYMGNIPELRGVSFENFTDRWIRLDAADLWRAARAGSRLGVSETEFTEKEKTLLAFFLGRAQILRAEGDYDGVGYRGSHTYRVALDEERLRSFLLSAAALTSGSEPSTAFIGEVDSFLESLGPVRGYVSIGKYNHLLRALSLAGSWSGERGVSNFSVTFLFSDYGKPVEVAVPRDAQTAEEIMRNIFGGLFGRSIPLLPYIPGLSVTPGESLSAGEVASPGTGIFSTGEKDTDSDGLPDILEAFYRTNSRNPDSDDDGVTDGEEVRRGQNPAGAGKLFQFGLPP